MTNYKIAIIITSFLRDKLLYKTIQTIVKNYTKESIVLIGDQGYNSQEKLETMDYYQSQIPLLYFRLPFDCGLSYARNFLVQKAYEKNIPYTLMMADSIQFINSYNFQPIIKFLEQNQKIGLVGMELKNSKCPWEFKMEITSDGIKLDSSFDYIEQDNIKYKKCDIVRNIFLAKTSSILNLWDNEMKLGEHELAFLEYRKRGFEVFYTNSIIFQKINNSNPEEYQSYRKRFNQYQQILKQKLNIPNWIIYSDAARQEIKDYQKGLLCISDKDCSSSI